jgi:hypothetical protein
MEAYWYDIRPDPTVVYFIHSALCPRAEGTDSIAFVEVPSLLRGDLQTPEHSISIIYSIIGALHTMRRDRRAMASASSVAVVAQLFGLDGNGRNFPPKFRRSRTSALCRHATPSTELEKVSLPQSRPKYPTRRFLFRQCSAAVGVRSSRRTLRSLNTHQKAETDG